MPSKCKEKYGKEWSIELTNTTLSFFDEMPMGIVKHINGKGYRHAVCSCALYDLKALVPPEEKDSEVFLFTLKDNPAFDCSYQSVTDLVDDGWAID